MWQPRSPFLFCYKLVYLKKKKANLRHSLRTADLIPQISGMYICIQYIHMYLHYFRCIYVHMIHWNLNFFVGFPRAHQALSHVLLRMSVLQFAKLWKNRKTQFQIFWGLYVSGKTKIRVNVNLHLIQRHKCRLQPSAMTVWCCGLTMWVDVGSADRRRGLSSLGMDVFCTRTCGSSTSRINFATVLGWWMCSLIRQRQWIWVFWFLKHLERHNLRHLALFGS